MSPLFDEVSVTPSTIRYRLGEALRSSGFILDDLLLDYGDSAGDLTVIPQAISYIPGIFNVAPLVWYTGAEVSVPFRDDALEQGLEAIRRHIRTIYPDAAWHGSIRFDGPAAPTPPTHERSAALFSGGLDSVATLFRHIDEKPVLITVAGSDIKFEDLEAWDRVKAYVSELGATYGCENAFVRGNMKLFIDSVRIRLIPPLLKERIGWWLGVQHGMGLTSLAAPIVWQKGVGRLYIASTHSEGFTGPWGSGPEIDNNIRWTGFNVVHDAFDTSRQMKIVEVIRASDTQELPRPRLRVCASKEGDHSTNCCECEKCLRTVAGVMTEGESPRAWGFDIEPGVALKRMRSGFGNHDFKIQENELFMWSDIQSRAQASKTADAALREWIENFNFKIYWSECYEREGMTANLRRLISRLPFVYKMAVTAKHSARSLRSRLHR